MTNCDRIKNMSVEELAKFINDVAVCCFKDAECENCPINCRITAVYCTSQQRVFVGYNLYNFEEKTI